MDANAPDDNSHQKQGEDWLGVMAWIDKYCAAHPLDKLYTAANALENELLNRHPAPPKSEEKH
jgi:hypothetical protein